MLYSLLFLMPLVASFGLPCEVVNALRPAGENSLSVIETANQDKFIEAGILNRKARKLPKPVYSKEAKAAGAFGEVKVEVVVDSQTGKVTEAIAISGHSLLQPLAVAAAIRAEFYPVFIDGRLPKVKGILIYNFTLPKRRRT